MVLFSFPHMFDIDGVTTRHASALVVVGEEHALRRLAQELSTISSFGKYLEVTLYQYPVGLRLVALSLEYEHLVTTGSEFVRQRIQEGYPVELANAESQLPLERFSYTYDPQRSQINTPDTEPF